MASAGRVVLLPKGAWASGTAYVPLDYVLYNGSSYVCKLAVAGVTSPDHDTTHWQLLAQGFDAQEVAQVLDDDPNKIPSNKAVSDALGDVKMDHVTVDLTGSGMGEQPDLVNADTLGHRITASDVDAKVKYTDALTLSQIQAASDLTNKVASAGSVKELNQTLANKLDGNITGINVGQFTVACVAGTNRINASTTLISGKLPDSMHRVFSAIVRSHNLNDNTKDYVSIDASTMFIHAEKAQNITVIYAELIAYKS